MHECVGKLLRMEVEYKTPLVRPNWREKYPDDEDVQQYGCKQFGVLAKENIQTCQITTTLSQLDLRHMGHLGQKV